MPTQLIDRWENRIEPKPEESNLYWHILLEHQPQVQAVASVARERLAGFRGLHFTPLRRLHITTFTLGSDRTFTSGRIAEMTAEARRLSLQVSPITITLRKVLYHPEAIVMKVEPDRILDPIRDMIRQAMQHTVSRDTSTEFPPWIPHVTLAYSTSVQPAEPVITALGYNLPACKANIKSVSLVAQRGAERLWDWRSVAEINLSANTL